MNQEIREQLSALIDNELDRDRMRFLLKRAEHDAELVALWQRWHLLGEVMRGSALPLRKDFLRGISARLDQAQETDMPLPSAGTAAARPAGSRAPDILRWSGGAALAASVALAALIFVRPEASLPGSGPSLSEAGRLAQQNVSSPAPAVVAPSPYREQDLRPPYRLDAQVVAAGEFVPFRPQLRLEPQHQPYWAGQAGALPRSQMQVWSVPLRQQPSPPDH